MNEDIYLNLAVDLYSNGTWDKETLIRKVTLYAQEKNMDMVTIKAFLDRLTNVKEYTTEDKRKILSVIKLGESELKYGNVINSMSDELVEKFYKAEEESLGKDRIEKYYNIANNKVIKPIKEEKQTVIQDVPTKPKELTPRDIKIVGNITLEDVIYGNYTPDDLLGITEKDSDEIFNMLVSSVDERSFNTVVANLRGKLGISYAGKFTEEWRKAHSNVSQKEQQNEKKLEDNGFHKPEPLTDSSKKDEKKRVVIPPFADFNMPETEEEYEEIEKKVTTPEKDSSVRKINISPERLAKLKKTKNKVLNFSIKTIMLVAALNLLNPIAAIGLVGGYMYFAEEIRCGKFNPSNPIGKAIKSTVEKIMYIGMGKDKKEELEKEGGKTR